MAEFDELIVTAELDDVEAVEEDEDDELLPRVETRLPELLPRLPASRGAMMAANFSAVTEPDTRIVRFKSPTETAAVRTTAAVGPPPPS